jgi:hypothetical protein
MLYTARAMPIDGASAAWVHSFKAEDGTPVFQSGDRFKTSSGAREALDKLIGKASQVIKQDLKKDEKGHIVGKRVELVFRKGRKAAPNFVIAWRK